MPAVSRSPLALALFVPWALTLHLAHASVALAGEDEGGADIDYVALAARLIKDGHFDRAQAALDEVDASKPDLDRQRYHTLAGLLALKRKDFEPARKGFDRAIKAQIAAERADAKHAAEAGGSHAKKPIQPEPVLLLYLAQANYGLKRYERTLEVLDRAGKALDDETSVHLMRAQSNWELKRPGRAIAALKRGARIFSDDSQFTRLQVFYLIELGLYQEVMDMGQRYLARAQATAEDYVAVGEALRQGKQLDKAGLILEGAHLRYPESEQIMLALAHVYLDRERPLSAAMLLEDAARLNAKYTVEAAELYKQAGRLERALSLNARVRDQKEKLKQRLSILLAMERFELVAAMAPSLSRTGLLGDDNVRYALAYGYYKIGDFASAEQQLKTITESELFNNANQLRKAMQTCRSSGWECI
ncbi:MAG: hypothetical protein OXT09_20805 [Myxococcales bacterium]|nr:hypothetical protein [Myxococcales bacterium]